MPAPSPAHREGGLLRPYHDTRRGGAPAGLSDSHAGSNHIFLPSTGAYDPGANRQLRNSSSALLLRNLRDNTKPVADPRRISTGLGVPEGPKMPKRDSPSSTQRSSHARYSGLKYNRNLPNPADKDDFGTKRAADQCKATTRPKITSPNHIYSPRPSRLAHGLGRREFSILSHNPQVLARLERFSLNCAQIDPASDSDMEHRGHELDAAAAKYYERITATQVQRPSSVNHEIRSAAQSDESHNDNSRNHDGREVRCEGFENKMDGLKEEIRCLRHADAEIQDIGCQSTPFSLAISSNRRSDAFRNNYSCRVSVHGHRWDLRESRIEGTSPLLSHSNGGNTRLLAPSRDCTPLKYNDFEDKSKVGHVLLPFCAQQLLIILADPIVESPLDYGVPQWKYSPLGKAVLIALSQDKSPNAPNYFLYPLWRKKECIMISHSEIHSGRRFEFEVITRPCRILRGSFPLFGYKVTTTFFDGSIDHQILDFEAWLRATGPEPSWNDLMGDIKMRLLKMPLPPENDSWKGIRNGWHKVKKTLGFGPD